MLIINSFNILFLIDLALVASLPKKRLNTSPKSALNMYNVYAKCLHCGRCRRKASISNPFNGLSTKQIQNENSRCVNNIKLVARNIPLLIAFWLNFICLFNKIFVSKVYSQTNTFKGITLNEYSIRNTQIN